MLDQFTDDARRAVVRAQEEARRLDHPYIGTEHLLLGLLGLDASAAAVALSVSVDAVRQQVEQLAGRGGDRPGSRLPFTVAAKQAIEGALAAASRRKQKVGPQHMLLGLLDQQDDVAVRVLVALGTDITQARQEAVESLA